MLAHAGAARLAYNWALARVRAVLDQRAAERSYGVPDDLLTPAIGWSLPALRRAWNAAKDVVAPWWRQVSKEAFNTGRPASALVGGWGFRGSSPAAGLCRRCGLPPARSESRRTVSMWCCRGWGG
ncbi:hypothetical protein ACFQ0D_07610 [Micromonospora zhanjiangensis]